MNKAENLLSISEGVAVAIARKHNMKKTEKSRQWFIENPSEELIKEIKRKFRPAKGRKDEWIHTDLSYATLKNNILYLQGK